jgi:hypothetical protein
MGRFLASSLLTALLIVGCTRSIEVEKVLQVGDVHTGWYDAGIVDGKNKLVPSISLKLKSISQQPVDRVQLNAVFRRVGEPTAWGEHFVQAIGPSGLSPGATTRSIVLRSRLGYTGTDTRLQLLQNSQFVDARVDIFAKHGSRNWVKLGEYQIDRQLLTE